jgi:hypothetical protein
LRFWKRSASISITFGRPAVANDRWYAVMSSDVNAFVSAPMPLTMRSYALPGSFSVPRNIMCSKKCAKPVTPSSTSSRDPVRTTVQYDTSPSLGIGTMSTESPLSSFARFTS